MVSKSELYEIWKRFADDDNAAERLSRIAKINLTTANKLINEFALRELSEDMGLKSKR